MLIWKALHIVSMFGGTTLLVAEGLLYARAIWRGESPGWRRSAV
jgi:hypothetical protein